MLFLGNIVTPAGTSRSNVTTGAATLDLGGLAAGHLDTVIRAYSPGVAGDDITVALVFGAPAGVTISRVGSALTIHARTGVSTVAAVEAAIAALSGADLLIAVDIPGTGATVLSTGAGDAFTATHLANGAAGAFTVPLVTRKAWLKTAGADCSAEISPIATVETTAARGFPLLAGIALSSAMPAWGTNGNIAVFNAGGGSETVEVWADALS